MSVNHVVFRIIFVGFSIFATEGLAEDQSPLTDVTLDRSIENTKRGAEITLTTCLACHGIRYLNYRHLRKLGFTQEQLDGLRAGKSMESPLVSKIEAEQLEAMFGISPPDLSLMAVAHPQGSRYIYSLLTGYYKKPGDSLDNHLVPGIRMPDVLGYANASDPSQRTKLERQAKAIAVFLDWAADPHASERTRLGYFVMPYLIFLTILLYLVKHRVWRRIEQTPPVKR